MPAKRTLLHRHFTATASRLWARLNAPAAHVCPHCHVGQRRVMDDCDVCYGRGWCANNDPIQLLGTAASFLAVLAVTAVFLLAVAP